MSAAHGPDGSGKPSVSTRLRLQWEPAQQSWVLLYPEGMVKLNQSAGEILQRCDGSRSVAQIVAELEQAFEASGLDGEVREFLRVAADRNWVEWA
jgi:pyrroloquinoline quinone biosynthesis protein D